ncbi:MAG: SDR family oxidoreductase [Flavobacteriaceae bacterium]
MRILILGASGMLGKALTKNLSQCHEVVTLGRTPCEHSLNDVTIDIEKEEFILFLKKNYFDVIINCVAIIDHNFCKKNTLEALKINSLINKRLIENIKKSSKIIYISSDAVFSDDIKQRLPITPTAAQSYYGLSKELGEKILISNGENCNFIIIRTTIVGFSPKGKGFVNWIVNSLKNNNNINLFNDVFFNPITIWCLSDEIKFLLESEISTNKIVHINGLENISKYTFGVNLAKKLDLDLSLISQGELSKFSSSHNRCFNQVLEVESYESDFNRKLPNFSQTIDKIKTHYDEYD